MTYLMPATVPEVMIFGALPRELVQQACHITCKQAFDSPGKNTSPGLRVLNSFYRTWLVVSQITGVRGSV